MKRKLTLAIWLSLTATSPLAQALGLGEAEVRSTLNAPLRATIPLTDTAGIQPGLLNVSVADDRAFAAAGFTRTPLASSVRSAVEQQQGRLVVHLTTERPVREPWVDLLLRFDWPGGSQVREVTLLLDPPDYAQMPPLVPGRGQPSRTLAQTPPPRSAPEPAVVARPSAPATSGDPAWVRSGDTLWAVAGRLRPDSGISMNQMMVALVEANPEAFPSGNINAMRAGVTLVVPGRETLMARAPGEADRLVQAMNQAWANRGSGAPARVPLGLPSDGPATSVAMAPAEPTAPEAAMPEESLPEEVMAAAEAVAGVGEAPHLTLLTDAEVAAEAARSGRDPEAGLEETAAEAREDLSEGGPTAPTLLAMLEGEGELSEDERLLRLEGRWRESQEALATMQEERDRLREELGEMREELTALREELALMMAGGAGIDAAGGGGVVPPGGAEPPAEEMPWWGALYQGEMDRNLMFGGAGLAALLALWLAVRYRRRREEAEEGGFGEVRVVVPGTQGPVTPSMADAATAEAPAAETEERPVRSAVPQAEAINEADIFIAYGRLDQARELLQASLEREPERDDLRLKLLGLHLQQGDREDADRQIQALRDSGDPAVLDEMEDVLVRHRHPPERAGLRAAPEATDGEGRSVFMPTAELPPRRFDETEAPSVFVPDAGEARTAGEPPGEREDASTSEASPGEATAAEEPPAEAVARERRRSALERRAVEQAEPEPDPLPPITRRQADDGREIIDYRPPPLDPSPAPREETPMQPSVEFTPSGPSGEAASSPSGGIPEEWEVEEVAFPSLDRDNTGFSVNASSADDLAKARRLLDAGEHGRARTLLEVLVVQGEPAVQEEARDLLNRLEP